MAPFPSRPFLPRRRVLAMAAPLAIAGVRQAQAAEDYPRRPVTLVVPFPVGGSTHFVAQLLARRLGAALGQPFSLQILTGENGLAAMADVARAAPDGHRLVLSPNSTFAMAPHYFASSLVVERDLAPIGLVASNAMVLCVHADSGYRRLPDLIEAARLAPGRIRYGTAGIGVSNHLAVELFARRTGITFQQVSFSGGAPAMHALLHDQVQFSFVDLVTAIPRVAGGALRPLAVTSARRVPQMAEVPTIAEQGLEGYRATTDFALFAPAGTPEAVLERLSRSTMAVMAAEETRELLAPLAIEPWVGSRSEFPGYLREQNATWEPIIARIREDDPRPPSGPRP